MINVSSLKVNGRECMGVRVDLPESPPLVLIMAERGFVMCGFLNVETAERLGVCAAMVSGVKTFDDVLTTQVKAVTSRAKTLGVDLGITGAEALKRMS